MGKVVQNTGDRGYESITAGIRVNRPRTTKKKVVQNTQKDNLDYPIYSEGHM